MKSISPSAMDSSLITRRVVCRAPRAQWFPRSTSILSSPDTIALMAAAIVVSESVRVPGHALHVRAARASRPEGSALRRPALAVRGDAGADARTNPARDHFRLDDRPAHFGLEHAHGARHLPPRSPLEPLEAPPRLAARPTGSGAQLRELLLERPELLVEVLHRVPIGAQNPSARTSSRKRPTFRSLIAS